MGWADMGLLRASSWCSGVGVTFCRAPISPWHPSPPLLHSSARFAAAARPIHRVPALVSLKEGDHRSDVCSWAGLQRAAWWSPIHAEETLVANQKPGRKSRELTPSSQSPRRGAWGSKGSGRAGEARDEARGVQGSGTERAGPAVRRASI